MFLRKDRHILLRKSDELNGATRDHYEKVKQYLQQQTVTTYINRDIRTAFRIPATTVRRYHNTLIENNYINGETIRIDASLRMQPK